MKKEEKKMKEKEKEKIKKKNTQWCFVIYFLS